jgi:hypothetical protein
MAGRKMRPVCMVQNLINDFTFTDVGAVKGAFVIYNFYLLLYIIYGKTV